MRLGYEERLAPLLDDARQIRLCLLCKDGCMVELVSPTGPDSPVAGLQKRYQNAPYHLCYEATDFEAELAGLEAGGYTRIDAPAPAPAFSGRRVVFLMSPTIGMLELLEEAPADQTRA